MYRSPFVDMLQDLLGIGLIWTLLMIGYIIIYGRLY